MAKKQFNKAGQSAVNTQPTLEVDEWDDSLPIDKELISYSLGLGLTLLAIFILSFRIFK